MSPLCIDALHYNCDPAWENGAYVHTKFDYFSTLGILITYCVKRLINEPSATSAVHSRASNTTYRTCIYSLYSRQDK